MRVRAFFWPLHGHRCLKQAVFFCSYDASSMSEQDEHSGTRVSGKKSVVLFYLYTFFCGQHHCCLPLHPTTASPRTVFSWPKSLCSLPTSKDWRRWPADQLFLALRGMRHGVGRRVAKKKQGVGMDVNLLQHKVNAGNEKGTNSKPKKKKDTLSGDAPINLYSSG